MVQFLEPSKIKIRGMTEGPTQWSPSGDYQGINFLRNSLFPVLWAQPECWCCPGDRLQPEQHSSRTP